MRDLPEQELLDEGRMSWEKEGLLSELESCYQSMVESARRTAEVLSEADVRALENGIALESEAQQLYHANVIDAAREISEGLPQYKVKPLTGRQEVPTRILDEDSYPVGGYASISNRGSIESLLHSQLAYMEPAARPDLFDIKYLRDELFFYSRDENQFLRRRRSYVFVFYPDLLQAKYKDPESRFQRIVLLLGLIYVGIDRLGIWLTGDALKFDFLFVTDGPTFPLTEEYSLIQMLFREQIENHHVEIYPTVKRGKPGGPFSEADVAEHCRLRSQRSMCNCLLLSTKDRHLEAEDTVVSRMVVNDVAPALGHGAETEALELEDWAPALERLLQIWV